MDFKKCERCGCFFVSNDNICCNCAPKDKFEISQLKNYFENNQEENSINNISIATGISIKNLNRYFTSNELNKYSNQFINDFNKQDKKIELYNNLK